MKKFFRRLDRSKSISHERPLTPDRRFSLPSTVERDVLYSGNRHVLDLAQLGVLEPHEAGNVQENAPGSQSDASSVRSLALSESETLALSEPQHFELQDSYQDNFTAYLPFLLRRLRIQQRRIHYAVRNPLHQGSDLPMAANEASQGPPQDDVAVEDSDDEKTISSLQHGYYCIMNRSMTSYNRKSSLLVVSEFIKSATYVFPSPESYALFKELRLSKNKQQQKRRNSVIVYDENNNISRITGASLDSLPQTSTSNSIIGNSIIDRRRHIIPVEYKIKGTGLPIFKISAPYMSSFRRKTPYMVFRKYLEIPHKPLATHTHESDDSFESYVFCQVHTKMFLPYKRYLFHFTPAGGPSFSIYVFQNNSRPFTDFTYKGTRFRIFGTQVPLAYVLTYSPELKLFVLDDLQPSLADNLIERERRSDLLSRSSQHRSSEKHVSSFPDESPITSGNSSSSSSFPSPTSPTEDTWLDPVPRSDNPIVLDSEDIVRANGQTFIPNNSPPFSRFVDSNVYQGSLFIPKRYSEVGKVEVYQDPDELRNVDPQSTYAIDTDALVLTTILLTFREVNLRMANRQHRTNRASPFGAFPALGPDIGVGFPVI